MSYIYSIFVYINSLNVKENLNNQIIWNDFRNGSKEALKFIYEDNYAPLFHYGMKITCDEDLVKDIIQDLFIELIDSGIKLSRTDNIRFYLLKALRNKLFNKLSRISKYSYNDSRQADFSMLESIEEQLIKKEIKADVQKKIINAIKKLSRKQQEIIYLHFYNDMSYHEIAEIFEVKLQTVRNLMNRSIQSLKRNFEDNNNCNHLILMLLNLKF